MNTDNKEIKKRKRTYKFSQPQKTIPNGWCHQCKSKKDELIVCKNFWKGNQLKCSGKYCKSCVGKNYEEDYEQLIAMDAWICYSCMGRCICANCKRDRGNNIPVRKRGKNKKDLIKMENNQMSQNTNMRNADNNYSNNTSPLDQNTSSHLIQMQSNHRANEKTEAYDSDYRSRAIYEHYNSSVDPSIKKRQIDAKLFEYWKNDLQRSFQGIHPVEDERINQNLEKMDNYEFDEHDNIIAVHVYYDPNHATNPQKWSDDIYL